ncbi:hypothetical protein A9993_07560 [Rahnella victoriana]|nr:hypothetical protein A9993_07560 [Rahnella victoriana]
MVVTVIALLFVLSMIVFPSFWVGVVEIEAMALFLIYPAIRLAIKNAPDTDQQRIEPCTLPILRNLFQFR